MKSSADRAVVRGAPQPCTHRVLGCRTSWGGGGGDGGRYTVQLAWPLFIIVFKGKNQKEDKWVDRCFSRVAVAC